MKRILAFLLVPPACFAQADAWGVKPFPAVREYDGAHLYRLALPMGGIGTGSVSLGGRGELRDWELQNVPGKFTTPGGDRESPFFAIRAKGSKTYSSILEGRLYDWEILHWGGSPAVHHGFPRFAEASFSGSFPAGTAHLRDRDFPFEVDVTGFNPFVPGDAEGSGLPVATLTYSVKNTGDGPLEVTIAGLMRNFTGHEPSSANRNEYRDAGAYRGVFFASGDAGSPRADWGTMALVTEESEGISFRTASTTHSTTDNWWNAILDWWDDFTDDGAFEERSTPDAEPIGTLAVKKTLAPGETREFTFHIVWNFPNRYGWSQTVVGNWYSRLYVDAWDAAAKILPQLPELERKSRLFTETVAGSDLPDAIKEAALFNLSVLKSQTVFRMADGHLMGWEGCADTWGTCEGNCTHVWNYEQAVAFLFPDLARTMRDVEFNYATRDGDGFMSFRVGLPLAERGTQGIPFPAADGQMGCVMKVYRDWQLSGDGEWLAKMWPRVKLVLSYAWRPGSWDEDADGVMEGEQHNTMDVNYYGPNSQMQFWYMGALRAAEEMAKATGDVEFGEKCRTIREKAREFTDGTLFNGEYYEQAIYSPATRRPLAEGEDVPDFQLGKACLVDQLVGQQFANLVGLGWLCSEKNVRKASESVMKYNWRDGFAHHFNNMRTFAANDERALLMASFPRGRPKVPFPYFSEVMTGFEYVAAVEMILEGDGSDGLKVIEAIRERHDGAKRNPYSEPEWGHNYARSMASWGALNAWSGFWYSAVGREMRFGVREGRFPWFVGGAWGTVEISGGVPKIGMVAGSVDVDKIESREL
ncbi:MAG: hypothetical protein ILO34_08510 [Kiritimatiellae bacterium]|nr:hypothetical protein [Kiritimatiellia bacterium]